MRASLLSYWTTTSRTSAWRISPSTPQSRHSQESRESTSILQEGGLVSTWWQVPPVAKVVLNGRLPRGACGKDIIIALCGLFPDEILNHTVEFTGSGVSALSIDERLAIANMTTEWGALA